MKKVLFISLLMLLPMVAAADSVLDIGAKEIGGIAYELDSNSKEAEVTCGLEYSGNVVIPEEVEYNGVKYCVTSIGVSAFGECNTLTSVTIPNSVTSIGDGAFQRCSGLTSITIPNSVKSIGVYAFLECTGLTSVTIGNGVTTIEWSAFENCSRLTSVTIGNSVKSIGDKAFWKCSSLNSVTIPNSVTSMGEDTFKSCSSLTSVTIGNSVTSIGKYAFAECYGLTSVTIGNSVKSIEACAFSDCTGLTTITIPNSVTKIGVFAFGHCSSLTSITFGDGLTTIGERPFWGCSSLTSVTIPNSVTSIGKYAFAECYGLTSVTIGNSVTSIGEDAFYKCSSLTSITIPNSVTSIGYGAFEYCSSLTSVTIGEGVTSIGLVAFEECTSLSEVISKIKNPFDIDAGTFSNNTYKNAKLTVPAGTIDKYKAKAGWKKFVSIQDENGNSTGNPPINQSGDGVVAEIDWTAQSAYYDGVWYADQAEVSVVKGVGLIINCNQTNANANYWEPQVPIIAHVPEIAKGGIYQVKFSVNAPAAGEIRLELCSWDGSYATKDWIGNVAAGDNDFTIDFFDYPTACTDAMLFYQCGKIPGRHIIRKVQIIQLSELPTKYNLTYEVDGKIYKTYKLKEGDVITPEPEPKRIGYTFSGWSDIPDVMPAHDVTVTGSFTKNSINQSGDGVVAEIDWTAQSVYYDDVWYAYQAEVSVVEGEGLIINNTQTNANANYWEPQVPIIAHIPELAEGGLYQVKFSVNAPAAGEIRLELCSWDGSGATKDAIINVVAGENDFTIDFFDYPTACTDAMLFYQCGKIPGRHIIKKVQVLELNGSVSTYSLIYKVDGEIYKTYKLKEGDVITPEPEPTKEGYTFSGWSEIPPTMPAKDVTVTGYFTKNEDVRKFESGGITYNVNDNGTTVTVTAGYTKYKGSITIPTSVSHNGKSYNVTSIGYGAFSDCTGLNSISLGSVMYIQSNAFYGCSGLSSITLPNSLVHIGESAFAGCSSLTNIVSEIESPFSIEGNTFDNSTLNNATLTVPAGTIDKYKATEGWKNFAFIVDETSITQDEIVYQINDGNVTVTQSDNASGDIKIEASVVINDITYEVTVIAKGAFEGCTDITSVEIPNTIIIISEKAFAGCTGLRVIVIGNGIQEIGRKAFANLSSSNARTRGDEEGLHFYCEAEVVPATSAEAFVGTDLSKATLHVPDHMVEVYKQVAPWSGFGNIVGLSDTSIRTINIDTSDALIFDMQGNRLNYPQKGLNIIRMSDGTTRKVLVK